MPDVPENQTLLIAGPTASGKSALALERAGKTGGWIVNADSMQVYAGLRILSARPSDEELARAPHKLYGFVPSCTEFSTGDWLRAAESVIAEADAAERRLIFVGGTGLYFKALTEGLAPVPPAPENIRARWRAAAESGADIASELRARDPEAAARISPGDTTRLTRALEVIDATGRSILDWRKDAAPPLLAAGSWRGIFLNPPREKLYARINARFAKMLQAGALEEVRALLALNLPVNRGIMKAHGMPHLAAHLNGEIGLDEAAALSCQDTRNYAKRQMIWARKFMSGWERAEA